MNAHELAGFLDKYGFLFLFLIVYLEYLNIPGFPGGLIFVLAGLWIVSSGQSFFLVLAVSVLSGLAGSLSLYLVGAKGGVGLLKKFEQRSPKWKDRVERLAGGMRRHVGKTVFLAKLTPVARTLIGLVAGMFKVSLGRYIIFSILGITVWNTGFILAGMYFSGVVLPYLSK